MIVFLSHFFLLVCEAYALSIISIAAMIAAAPISNYHNNITLIHIKTRTKTKLTEKKKKHTTTSIQNDLANRHPDDLSICIHKYFLDQMSSNTKVDVMNFCELTSCILHLRSHNFIIEIDQQIFWLRQPQRFDRFASLACY